MDGFEGKVVVITGAGSGIGLAMARAFALQGASVVLSDVEASALDAAADEVRSLGARTMGVVADVARRNDIENLLAETLEEFGRVHVLCNNAGVQVAAPAWRTTPGQWEWILGVNLWGVIHGVSVFVPQMLEQGDECHIVNTASASGLVSSPFMAAYQVTKHGVVTLTESLSLELKQQNAKIGVSVLCPAFVQTNIHKAERNRPEALDDGSGVDPTVKDAIDNGVASLIEGGKPAEEVAGAALQAIRENRLHVLTHAHTADDLRKRVRVILGE